MTDQTVAAPKPIDYADMRRRIKAILIGSVGNLVVFTASATGDSVTSLWRSDGTGAGTYPIASVVPWSGSAPLFVGDAHDAEPVVAGAFADMVVFDRDLQLCDVIAEGLSVHGRD